MTQMTERAPEQIETEKVYREMGLSEQEYNQVKAMLSRRPNFTEIGIFSVMWSEHCSYKTSKELLKRFPVKARHVLQGPGEGAGIIDIGDEQAVVFKVESHNSPSAVEPYNGAATGAGGILRDIFSMGARPVALLNSLRFGHLQNDRTKHLFQEVVRGIADYGNGVGVPVIGGEIQFDDCYEKTPLVNAMGVGLVNHKTIQNGVASGVGNTVIYAGATTGRDGIHGATFASDDLPADAKEQSSIPVGDPLLEKDLIEACSEVAESDALVGMQDMGAAGLTSSASEMASKAGTGISLDLDLVPKQDKGMSAYELMLSESQERMLMVVQKGREQEIIDTFANHDLQAVAIGEVIEDKSFRLMRRGELVADIPVDALTEEAPVYQMPSEEPAYFRAFQQMEHSIPLVTDHRALLKKLLEQPTIASKEWVYDQFAADVQNNVITGPGWSAGIIRVEGTNKALAVTTDCNSRYFYLDPETGGKIAVAEAARNIVCTGAKPLAITDGLNFGNPTNPEVYWQMEQSITGISEACRMLKTPVISGNVSLNNESEGEAIFPTPVVGMVGLITSLEHVTSSQFQQAGDAIYLIGASKAEFGGSELQRVLRGAEENETYTGKAPAIDLDTETKRQEQLLDAIQEGVIQSAHDVAEGGLAVALAESCFTENELGITVNLKEDLTVAMFSESQSRFLVSVKPDQEHHLKELVDDVQHIGTVTDDEMYTILNNGKTVVQESVASLYASWKGAVPCLLKSKA